MINLITGIVTGLMGLGDKMIEDKDLKREFAFKTQELVFKLLEKLVEIRTVPWVDATVKLLTSLVVLARPIGAFILTLKGIDLFLLTKEVDFASGGLMSLFPSWMGFRQYDKYRKKKADSNLDPFE